MNPQFILAIRNLAPYAISIITSQYVMQSLSPAITAVSDRTAQVAQNSLLTSVLVTATHFPFRLIGNTVRGAFGTFVRAKPGEVMFSVTNVGGVWNTYMTHEFATYGTTLAYKCVVYAVVMTVVYHLGKGLVAIIYTLIVGVHAQGELRVLRDSSNDVNQGNDSKFSKDEGSKFKYLTSG